MVFSSNVFLFLFLPIFLGLYYLCANRYRNLLLLIGSYVFYAWWRVDFLRCSQPSRCGTTGFGLESGAAGVRHRTGPPLAVGSAWSVNLAIAGLLQVRQLRRRQHQRHDDLVGLQPFVLTHVLLPIGISFYIFRVHQLHHRRLPGRYRRRPATCRLRGLHGAVPAPDRRPGAALPGPRRPVQQPHPHPRQVQRGLPRGSCRVSSRRC